MAKPLELTGIAAVEELEAATQKYKNALKSGEDEYTQLLSKYEELERTVAAREAGDVEKAETDEARSYVLLLVDAHSHTFYDKPIRDAVNDGGHASDFLKDRALQYLENLPEYVRCQILCSLNADFAELCRESKFVQDTDADDLKALQLFAAAFSSRSPLFDFNSLTSQEDVRCKVLGKLCNHGKDPACKQIFLGVCGHEQYLDYLTMHSGLHNKVTLIQGSSVDTAMEVLGIKSATLHPFKPSKGRDDGTFKNNRYISHASQKREAISPSSVGSTVLNPKLTPSQLPNEARSDYIPVNKAGHRLDAQIALPTRDQWDVYQARIGIKKLCNAFHLRGECLETGCEFDHNKIDADVSICLHYMLKEWPCRNKGECRNLECHNGHICQKAACHAGRGRKCRFSPSVHKVDKEVAQYVEAEEKEVEKEEVKKASLVEARGPTSSWPAMVDDLVEL